PVTRTPSPLVPSVLMFWTFTKEPTTANPRPPERNQTFSIVMLLDWMTRIASLLGGARMLDWSSAPTIVRLLLVFTKTFSVYTPGARTIVLPGVARLIAATRLPRGRDGVLPAFAPDLPP